MSNLHHDNNLCGTVAGVRPLLDGRRAGGVFSEQLMLRGLETVFQLSENLPTVRIAPNRLEQVRINLQVNARDAIKERRRCEPDALKRITLRVTANHYAVKLRVAGVSKELADKIFESFL
ncbi:MAG: hypothetical protein AB9872_01480 [Solidesulfovibrio sp.]